MLSLVINNNTIDLEDNYQALIELNKLVMATKESVALSLILNPGKATHYSQILTIMQSLKLHNLPTDNFDFKKFAIELTNIYLEDSHLVVNLRQEDRYIVINDLMAKTTSGFYEIPAISNPISFNNEFELFSMLNKIITNIGAVKEFIKGHATEKMWHYFFKGVK